MNRLSGHNMGESYGARVWKAEIGRGFQKGRESAGVEETRISRGFGKPRKDCSAPAVRVLGRLTVRASWNSIFIQQCRRVLPSSLALPFPIALASLRAWHVFLRWLFMYRQIMPSAQFTSPSVLSCCPPEKGSGGAGVVVGVRGACKSTTQLSQHLPVSFQTPAACAAVSAVQ